MAYIGKTPTSGDFVLLDSITTSATASYTMQKNSANFTPQSANHMIVSLNGTIQAPVSSFTVSGSTLTFASALTSSDVIDFILVLGNVNDVGTATTVVDSAITKNKLNLISESSSAGLTVKGDGSSQDGYIALNCSQNSHAVKIKAPPHSAAQSYTLTLPSSITNDYFLKTDGSGNLSFAEAGGGAFTKLSTVDLSSGDTNADFNNSIITSTYKQYFFTFTNLRPTADNSYLIMKESINNGSGFLSNDCDWHFQFQYTTQANTEYLSNSGANDTNAQLTSNHVGNGTMEGVSGQMFYSRDGANPSKGNWSLVFTNNNYVYYQNGGFYRDDASTTNYVRFLFSGTTFISGRITCYGIDT